MMMNYKAALVVFLVCWMLFEPCSTDDVSKRRDGLRRRPNKDKSDKNTLYAELCDETAPPGTFEPFKTKDKGTLIIGWRETKEHVSFAKLTERDDTFSINTTGLYMIFSTITFNEMFEVPSPDRAMYSIRTQAGQHFVCRGVADQRHTTAGNLPFCHISFVLSVEKAPLNITVTSIEPGLQMYPSDGASFFGIYKLA